MDLPAAIGQGCTQWLEPAAACVTRDEPSSTGFTASDFGATLLSYEIRPSSVGAQGWKDHLPGPFVAAQQLWSFWYNPYKQCIYAPQ